MTERSRPWDGTIIGDAFEAPYDASTEFARVLRALLPAAEQSVHKGGVVNGASGYTDYNATTGANQVIITPGIGFVQGTWHESDANVTFAISTPVTGTRTDRIVLRKSWANQTVRLTRLAGVESSGAPALTQSFGNTWDVPLFQVIITTASIISIVDERVGLLVSSHTHSSTATGGAVAHSALSAVTVNDHHTQAHLHDGIDASGVVAHTSLTGVGSNTHAAIDTHIATKLIGVHGVSRLNTSGTVSLGTPTAETMVLARANGGNLTVTTPSGSIFVGNLAGAASVVILAGDAYTLIADGTNWYTY